MNKENYNQRNVEWIINCINSCTNNEQLDCCEVLIGLFRFRLMKDNTDEKDMHDIARNEGNELMLLNTLITFEMWLESIDVCVDSG